MRTLIQPSAKRFLAILICWTSLAIPTMAQNTPVFISGKEGYNTFRIPAIVRAPNGDLLAFCEGRVNGGADFGHVDIVMKRSLDDGNSWGPLQVVARNGSLQAGNPAPVVDELDTNFIRRRIFLFYCTGDNTEGEVRKGNGLREVWYKTSTDCGETWSEGTNITTQVHRPDQPARNPLYHFPEDWRSFATTPGHAIQMKRGAHAGRIFIAANHSAGPPQAHFLDYVANGFYTDDHGKSFHIAADIPVPGGNEAMAVELPDGALMINARIQSGTPRCRLVAISHSGGEAWDTVRYDRNLPDPVCQGSIIEAYDHPHGMKLVFANNADTMSRTNLSAKFSHDRGLTWSTTVRVDGPAGSITDSDETAYSDLVCLRTGIDIGILYERNDYSEIVFTRFQEPDIRKRRK